MEKLLTTVIDAIAAGGPYLVLIGAIIFGIFRIAERVTDKVSSAMVAISDAMHAQARAMDRQSDAIEGVSETLLKQQMEHKEQLILLNIIAKKVE